MTWKGDKGLLSEVSPFRHWKILPVWKKYFQVHCDIKETLITNEQQADNAAKRAHSLLWVIWKDVLGTWYRFVYSWNVRLQRPVSVFDRNGFDSRSSSVRFRRASAHRGVRFRLPTDRGVMCSALRDAFLLTAFVQSSYLTGGKRPVSSAQLFSVLRTVLCKPSRLLRIIKVPITTGMIEIIHKGDRNRPRVGVKVFQDRIFVCFYLILI